MGAAAREFPGHPVRPLNLKCSSHSQAHSVHAKLSTCSIFCAQFLVEELAVAAKRGSVARQRTIDSFITAQLTRHNFCWPTENHTRSLLQQLLRCLLSWTMMIVKFVAVTELLPPSRSLCLI